MKKKQEHDVGPNLLNKLIDILTRKGIPIKLIDKNEVEINGHHCLAKYSNASKTHEFNVYFWGVGESVLDKMRSRQNEFLIFVGGRNLGNKAASEISRGMDMDPEKRSLMTVPRIEHAFIIPFKVFDQLVKGMPTTTKGQLKIDVYIDKEFRFTVTKAGSISQSIPGKEVKEKYLNRFELIEIDLARSNELRSDLKLVEDSFDPFLATWRQYKNILDLDRVSNVDREIEHKRGLYISKATKVEETPKEATEAGEAEQATHTGIEGLLIELGMYLGYDTYTVDSSKTYKNETLGELMTLTALPRFTDNRILNTAKEIDVIWFQSDFPIYAFEVEHTTDFGRGLQRLYQLRYFSTKFFLVATEDRKGKFETEIEKDPYFPIRERFRFLSYEDLTQFNKIVRECYDKGKGLGILWGV